MKNDVCSFSIFGEKIEYVFGDDDWINVFSNFVGIEPKLVFVYAVYIGWLYKWPDFAVFKKNVFVSDAVEGFSNSIRDNVDKNFASESFEAKIDVFFYVLKEIDVICSINFRRIIY